MTPFIFLLIAALITTLLKWGVDAVVPPISMPSSFSQNAQLAPLLAMQKQGMASSGGMISTLIVLPIFLLLAAFITTAVWHVSLMILGGANKPFEATYRVYCYVAGACALLSMVPCCGPFISLGWNIVASMIGLSKVHGIGSGKALTAILLPLILCCGLCSVGSYFLWNALSGNPEFMDAFNKALKDQ